MEDLVGVGVADAGEDARVGEGSLEGAVFFGQRGAEGCEVGGEDVDAAGVDVFCRSASLAKRWREARRLEPASVRTREPWGKSKAARLLRPPSLAPAGRQWRRPAIMRWRTSQRPLSSSIAMRLPMRRRERTVWPSTLFDGGLDGAEQEWAGDADVGSCWPTMRGSRAER